MIWPLGLYGGDGLPPTIAATYALDLTYHLVDVALFHVDPDPGPGSVSRCCSKGCSILSSCGYYPHLQEHHPDCRSVAVLW